MIRFALCLVLIVGLFSRCYPARSLPTIPEWHPVSAQTTLGTTTIQNADPFIWWEAEQPAKTNFPPSQRNPFAPAGAAEAQVLSNGQWIGIDGAHPEPLFLEYRVAVPSDRPYTLYARKFWQHGTFRWRWDNQPWRIVDHNVYLMDGAVMRPLVSVNWVSLGSVTPGAGIHTLRVELTEPQGAAAFDCFLLTATPFQPHGTLKPNQRYAANVTDGFIFDPAVDTFAPSPLDLRSLNETYAGEQGYIQTSGESFIHATTQQTVRFWAINMGMQVIHMEKSQMPAMARFWAKKGVNLVRLHGPLWSEDLKTIAPQDLQQLFALIAAFKQEGIYTSLSIYFPAWLHLSDRSPFPGYTGQNPFALLFFNPEFQTIYYNWWRAVLTTPNLDTGKLLRDDPALAMVELVNEDSYFFWTFQPYKTIPAPQMVLLEQQFTDWLVRKYGATKNVRLAWRTAPHTTESVAVPGDSADDSSFGILPVAELVAQHESRRAQDMAQFLAESQKGFFERAIAVLHKDLGYRGLVYASNWVTADARILDSVDKYTNTVGDFMDRHGYFSTVHTGEKAAYALSPGDRYADRSALLFQSLNPKQAYDFDLPIMDLRYNGLPSTITEINWAMPNRFRADFPLLAAAYGSLQDTDGFFFFAADHGAWQNSLGKFAIADPVILGQFPAAALIYRKGLVKPGETVVDISLNSEDTLHLKGAPVTAPQNLDAFRQQDVPTGQALPRDKVNSIDPLAFLVGKVTLRFAKTETAARQMKLTQYSDRHAQTVRSSTGELFWDYGNGLMTLNAPQAQGVTGFLHQGGAQTLSSVTIRPEMEYGTVLLVALDNQPLNQSHQMLLQVMSEEQNFGWQASGSPHKTIDSVGSAPIVVRRLAGQVSLQRPDASRLTVTALNVNGDRQTKLGAATQITLLPNVFYYLIEK